jgi:hypothetical protein
MKLHGATLANSILAIKFNILIENSVARTYHNIIIIELIFKLKSKLLENKKIYI